MSQLSDPGASRPFTVPAARASRAERVPPNAGLSRNPKGCRPQSQCWAVAKRQRLVLYQCIAGQAFIAQAHCCESRSFMHAIISSSVATTSPPEDKSATWLYGSLEYLTQVASPLSKFCFAFKHST